MSYLSILAYQDLSTDTTLCTHCATADEVDDEDAWVEVHPWDLDEAADGLECTECGRIVV